MYDWVVLWEWVEIAARWLHVITAIAWIGSSFYFIALEARVPIVMAYMDYERKLSGLGPMFVPTGDLEADMVQIKAFYAPFKGKNAAQFGAD